MVVLKTNPAIVLVIVLVSLKKVLSTAEGYESAPPSSPEKSSLTQEELPEMVVKVFKKREYCKKKIDEVFVVNSSEHDLIEYTIKTLILQPELNETEHLDYVNYYYNTLYRYVKPGKLKPFREFCEEELDLQEVYRVISCISAIGGMFTYVNPEDALYNAIYFINEEIVKMSENNFVTAYFYSIVKHFELDLAPENVTPFKNSTDYCKSIIPMPMVFKKFEIDLELHL